MISIEKDGWRVTRRIGVGDRELVRAGLLQVALMSKDHTDCQVEAALEVAKSVGKTLRVYVNTARLEPAIVQRLIFHTMGQSRNHDFMEESVISRMRFQWVLGRSDIVIERLGDGPIETLKELIKACWLSSYGRDFLSHATWRKTEIEVRQEFPEYFEQDEHLWSLYSKP